MKREAAELTESFQSRLVVRLTRLGIQDKSNIGLGLEATTVESTLGGESRCIMIEKVFEGGPAHNSGEIAVGNSILYLDGQDISSKSSKEISQMICGNLGLRWN